MVVRTPWWRGWWLLLHALHIRVLINKTRDVRIGAAASLLHDDPIMHTPSIVHAACALINACMQSVLTYVYVVRHLIIRLIRFFIYWLFNNV